MYRRPSSARLITALAIVSIVALVLPSLVSAAPVPVSAVTTSTHSAGALLQTAKTHAAAVMTAAVAAEAAAKAAAVLAEQQRAAAAAYTAARATAKKPAAKKPAAKASVGSDAARVQSILASLKARYPRYLSGVTVSLGAARGYQAISYYTSGRIVVSPTHSASLERILGHEIWHIIDWRDNGRIDWGERVPPSNAASYR
jgi:hypothetical protein